MARKSIVLFFTILDRFSGQNVRSGHDIFTIFILAKRTIHKLCNNVKLVLGYKLVFYTSYCLNRPVANRSVGGVYPNPVDFALSWPSGSLYLLLPTRIPFLKARY